MSRFRNAVFTWNNYPSDHSDQLSKLPAHTYIVYGYETGESGTPHLQGYVEFTDKVGFNLLKKRLPKVHWEARKGTAQQAADYCKKEAKDIFEEGTISKQGKRTDLDAVREQLNGEDGNLRNIVQTATSCQGIRFAEIYLKYHEKKRNFRPVITWLYGKAGTGKTKRVLDEVRALGLEDDLHTQVLKKWWDGYDAHKVVLIDDIRDTFCSWVEILQLLDRYACRIEAKGGSRQMLAQRMYITSPVAPELVWSNSEEKEQLLRRIDNIEEILSLDKSIVHKGNGIPLYYQEDIQEEDHSAQDEDESESTSEFSYQEVRLESDAEDRDEERMESRQRS